MRVSCNWLREYVELTLEPEALAERLTMAGVTVDAIEYRGRDVSGVVVGEILEVRPHPRADRLKVCPADIGARTVQIVSGAPNLEAGARVALALPGAVLPGGRRIEAAEFRGERSEGMPCSARELGLPEDRPEEEAGILVLAPDAPLGEGIVAHLGLDDAILLLDLTPNRGDCLSMLGVAREVAAITGSRLRPPTVTVPEDRAVAAGSLVRVRIDDTDLCPRYSARLLLGVNVGPSPAWLARRLLAAGMRPINNVVDLTNYVMLETGQPLHAFDYDRLTDGSIIVRRARAGERLVTLDGSDRRLEPDMLLICDPAGPVAIAGVMGGEATEVTGNTQRILLESAHFHPAGVRRTSRGLGLPSEASSRFEKAVDPAGTVAALDRIAALAAELGVARPAAGVVDSCPRPQEPLRVRVRPDRVRLVLGSGSELTAAAMEGLLTRLGFSVDSVDRPEGWSEREAKSTENRIMSTYPGPEPGEPNGGGAGADLLVTVPTRRPDITAEVDLIEEIGRLWGYDRIEAALPRGVAWPVPPSPLELVTKGATDVCLAAGLDEVVTYSFADPAALDRLSLPPDHPWRRAVTLRNPMSREQSQMRTSLLPGLLRVVALNAAHQETDLGVFECGTVYRPKSLPIAELPSEDAVLGAACCGTIGGGGWADARVPADIFLLKGVVEELAARLGIAPGRLTVEPLSEPEPFLHPGRAALVRLDDRRAGYCGELHPDTVAAWDVPPRTCVLELELGALAGAGETLVYRPLPRYPASRRDLAVVLPVAVSAAQALEVIDEAGGETLESRVLFDVYTGDQVPEGHRSLAFALTYRAADRTLTDEEVDAAQARVRGALEQRLGGRVR